MHLVKLYSFLVSVETPLLDHPKLSIYVFCRQDIPRGLRKQEKINPDGSKQLVSVPVVSGTNGTLLLFSNDLFGVTTEENKVRLLPQGDIYEYPKIVAHHYARISGNASRNFAEAFSGLVESLSAVYEAVVFSAQS